MKLESEALLWASGRLNDDLLKRQWLLAGGLAAAAVVWMLLWYFDTTASIVRIWIRSDTFAHGFVVVPISVYLIWGKRAQIAQLVPAPAVGGLFLLVLIGFGWLLGNLGHARVVEQFALAAMIPALTIALLGWRVARILAFPLAFLFLAVPVGEALIPPLMEFTADFTVHALRLSGVPVYREGTFFSIPSGNWSVVEGCSGLRYLMASVTGGFLFAYLSYVSLRRRLLFVAASVVVPIVANGIRAYSIVLIAHLSDMRLALGIDHLIYGWVFFGLVMLLLFWIGSKWQETSPRVDASIPPAHATGSETVSSYRILVSAVLAALAIGIWPIYAAHADYGLQRSLADLRPKLDGQGGWVAVPEPFTAWQPRYVGADASAFQTFRNGDRQVAVWLFYYATQREGAELVTTRNVMVVQKHPVWEQIGQSSQEIQIGQSAFGARTTLLRSVKQRLMVMDWFWISGHHLSDPYLGKLLLARQRLLGVKDPAIGVIIAVPYEDRAELADATLRLFIHDMLPSIEESTQGTWGN